MFDIDLKIGTFNNLHDTEYVLNKAIEIAKYYGHVNLADILDLKDEKTGYMDCEYGWTYPVIKYGWTYPVILKGAIVLTGKGTYTISLPKFDWFIDYVRPYQTPKSSVKPKYSIKQDHHDPEPINVTLPADKLEQTISILFKDLDKIKDRPVFINIM